MNIVPIWGKRYWKAIAAMYVVSSLWWGPAAEAAFHLDYAAGTDRSEGLHFLPAIEGLRTQPAPAYEPVRATGRSEDVGVTVRPDGDFWRALANCESPNGTSGRYLGYFQFHPSTWAATGGGPLGDYEHQRARAQKWASQVNPGSTAGWPVCWHRAKAAVG